MNVISFIPATRSVLSSKMRYSVDKTTTIVAKLVTYKSFCWTITQSVITIITWNSWQTPTLFQKDARSSTKILLPFNSNTR